MIKAAEINEHLLEDLPVIRLSKFVPPGAGLTRRARQVLGAQITLRCRLEGRRHLIGPRATLIPAPQADRSVWTTPKKLFEF
jgi:hypothetical protein